MGPANERNQLILSFVKRPTVLHMGCVGTAVTRTSEG
jgi:hypothetical protein